MSRAAMAWQRPKPRLVNLRDLSVACILMLMYTSGVPAYIYSSYQRRYGILFKPEPVCFDERTHSFHATVSMKDTGADYVGISLSTSFAAYLSNITSQDFQSVLWKTSASFSVPVKIQLKVKGFQCLPDHSDWGGKGEHSKQEAFTRRFRLVGAWLVLVQPASCESYEIAIAPLQVTVFPEAPPPDLEIVVQVPSKTWVVIGFWIRAIISCVFCVLTSLLMFQWSWVYMKKGISQIPLGLWSVFIMNAGIVLQCSPLELCGNEHYWTRCLPSIGTYLYLWSKLQFLREVLYDLKRFPSELDRPSFLDVSTPLVLSSGSFSSGQSAAREPTTVELSCFAKRWNFCMKILALAYAHSSDLFDILEMVLLAICAGICVWLARESQDLSEWSSSLAGDIVLGARRASREVLSLSLVGYLILGVFFIWIPLRMFTVGATVKMHAYSHCRVHYIVFSFFLLSNIINTVNTVGLRIYDLFRPRVGVETLTNAGLWYAVDKTSTGMLLPNNTNQNLQYVIIHAITAFIFTIVFGVTSGVDVVFSRMGAMRLSTRFSFAAGRSQVSMRQDLLKRAVGDCEADKVNLYIVRILAHCANAVYWEDLDSRVQTPKNASEEDLDFSSLELVEIVLDEENDTKVAVMTFQHGFTKFGVVAFRGTVGLKNVITDLKINKTELPWHIKHEGKQTPLVHIGFLTAFLGVRDQVLKLVERLECDMIWCCGHSLGGALATLMVSSFGEGELRRLGLCTFGCPRVGDTNFSELVANACTSIRVVCGADPFANVPRRFVDVNGITCRRPYTHVRGTVRVFRNGHLIARPILLEEALRFFIHKTCFIKTFNIRRLQHHQMTSYLECLHNANRIEKHAEENHASYVRRSSLSAGRSLGVLSQVSDPELELASNSGSFESATKAEQPEHWRRLTID